MKRNDRRRKHYSLRWRVVQPTHTPEELLDGTGDFILTVRDKEILYDLLLHNYLASRHLISMGHFDSRNALSKRMSRLHKEGVVGEITVSAWQEDRQVRWEYAFTLTAFGFECLALDPEWERHVGGLSGNWTPPYVAGSTRNNAIHDVFAADLCLGVLNEIRLTDHTAYWRSASRSVTRLPASVAWGIERHIISPDGVLVLPGSDRIILVEYEQHARPDTLRDKLQGYAEFIGQRAWTRDHPTASAPKVVLSLTRTADRQRYWASPLEEGRKIASEFVTLYPHLFVVDESLWRRGVWTCYPLQGNGRQVPLRDMLLADGLSRIG